MNLFYFLFVVITLCRAFAFRPTQQIATQPLSRAFAFRLPTQQIATQPLRASPLDDIFGNLFSPKPKKITIPTRPNRLISPDYRLALVPGILGLDALLLNHNLPIGSLLCIFSVFLSVQATRIRFLFDESAFELKTKPLFGKGAVEDSGENFVVGGANRWTYESFVNYDFFPSKEFPILVYFKETQTPQEKWGEGPGKLDSVGGGQLHFFPAIASVKELVQEFEARGIPKL